MNVRQGRRPARHAGMQSAKSARKLHHEVLLVPCCHLYPKSSNDGLERRSSLDMYHAMTWPAISFVAEDHKGRVVGYILAKMEEEVPEGEEPHGHVTSLSVLRTYRRLGLAKQLMEHSQEAMADIYQAAYVSLHVRKSNRAALSLYKDTLGFTVRDIEKKYYADGEDAYAMRLSLKKTAPDEKKDVKDDGKMEVQDGKKEIRK